MSLNQAPGRHIPMWTTGERMRKARVDAGLSQDQLAAEISISKRQIVYLERGEKSPTRGDLLLWQFATAVPVEWLLTGHTDYQPDGDFPQELRFDNLQARVTPIREHAHEYAAA